VDLDFTTELVQTIMVQRKVGGRRQVWPSWLIVVIVVLVATALRDGDGNRVVVLEAEGAFFHHYHPSPKLRSGQFHLCPPVVLQHHEKDVDDMDHNDYVRESQRTNPFNQSNRRDILLQATARSCLLTASSFLLVPTILDARSAAALEDSRMAMAEKNIPKRTIVITGANSGIGYQACRQLAQQRGGGHTIVLACRTLSKAQDAVQRIQDGMKSSLSSTLIPAVCDLADLSSIQTFAQTTLPAALLQQQQRRNNGDNPQIDVLCLNAGVARNTAATDCARTKDGFELTGTFLYFEYEWIQWYYYCSSLPK
jgi:CheY-like chemotaxis protein